MYRATDHRHPQVRLEGDGLILVGNGSCLGLGILAICSCLLVSNDLAHPFRVLAGVGREVLGELILVAVELLQELWVAHEAPVAC